MKKIISIVVLAVIFVGMMPGQSYAHGDDWGWFAAGAVAGVVTGAVIADSSYHHDGYVRGYDGYYDGCYRPYYPRCDHYVTYHTHYPGCGHYGYYVRPHCDYSEDYWY